MPSTFENAEREFFKLKGQRAAGRITQEQYDTALKELIVEDTQGKFWMLGADSGKWYIHDGQTWVEATPPHLAEKESMVLPAPPSVSRPHPPQSQSKTGKKLVTMILTGLGGLVTILVGIGVTWGQGAIRSAFLGSGSAPTFVIATTPTRASSPVFEFPTPSATPTFSPSATQVIIVLTEPSPTLGRSETPLPTLTLLRPSETPTITSVPTPLPATPTLTLPPGLFVTGLRLEPPAPRNGQNITFYPTFLNTANGEQNPRWLVYIYRRSNLKNSFGETAVLGTTIPIGQSEQKSAANWKVSGLNTCEDYVARVAWQDVNKQAIFFKKALDSIFELGFSICP